MESGTAWNYRGQRFSSRWWEESHLFPLSSYCCKMSLLPSTGFLDLSSTFSVHLIAVRLRKFVLTLRISNIIATDVKLWTLNLFFSAFCESNSDCSTDCYCSWAGNRSQFNLHSSMWKCPCSQPLPSGSGSVKAPDYSPFSMCSVIFRVIQRDTIGFLSAQICSSCVFLPLYFNTISYQISFKRPHSSTVATQQEGKNMHICPHRLVGDSKTIFP